MFAPIYLSLLFAAALGMLCKSAFAGTAGVANGDFTVDLNGWTLAGPPFSVWSMLDYQGNALSGSAELANDAAPSGIRLYMLRQCVHLPASGSYRIETEGFLPAGHVSGRLVVNLSGRTASDCSGGANFTTGYFVSSEGAWQPSTTTFSIISGFNYLDVSLGIEKDAAGGLLVGNFDAVHVIYRERIFTDGFDGGDLPSPDL